MKVDSKRIGHMHSRRYQTISLVVSGPVLDREEPNVDILSFSENPLVPWLAGHLK